MTKLLKTLALAAAIAMLAVPGFAQMGGIKEANLSPELDLLVNNGLKVYNATGGTLTAGELVYVCGYAEVVTGYVRQPKICAASNAASSTKAKFILPRSMVTASSNDAVKLYRMTAANTLGATVGDPVYLSTAGGWTLSAPGPSAFTQIVGRVAVVSATIGEIQFNLDAETNTDGGADLTAGSVGPDKLGITIRAGTALAAGDLVYLSSYSVASSAYIASIADSNVAYAKAQYVAAGTIGSGSTGTVYKSYLIPMITTGATVGDPVYLTTTGTTGNTMSLTPPSAVGDKLQIVGRVTIVTTTPGTGRVLVDLNDLGIEPATTEYRAGTFGAAILNAGTDAGVGTLDIYPATTANGKLEILATNNGAARTTTVTNAAQGGAYTYSIPDAGASANFVMSEGAATINGAKTFSTPIIASGSSVGTIGAGASANLSNVDGMHRTTITLATTGANKVTLADGDHGGGKLLYTFPEGEIIIWGAVLDGVVTNTGNFNASTNDLFSFAIGTGAAADDNDLTSTEANVVAKITVDTDSGGTLTRAEKAIGLTTPIYLDGTTTPITLYANFAVAATQNSGSNDFGVTGTLVILWSNAGDK
jgi:hypothetical protein